MRLNFTVYGSQYTYGWLPEGAKLIGAQPFLAEATRRGFSGAELSHKMLDGLSDNELRQVGETAAKDGLELVLSAFGTETAFLVEQIRRAAIIGAPTVRTVVGGAQFGGDRRAFVGGKWAEFMEVTRSQFDAVMPHATRAKIALAVENHQDVNSEDLLALCHHYESDFFGVVLDTANPLAVAEHPVDFALAVMPYIKYVHLKDYWIYWSAEGYRLVRCPVGAGDIPLKDIIDLCTEHGKGHSGSLELAALENRHVRCFEDDFWPEYPTRSAAQFARTIGWVRRFARPATEEYRTPFEHGASAAEIATYEERELQIAIRSAADLTGDKRPLQALEAGANSSFAMSTNRA